MTPHANLADFIGIGYVDRGRDPERGLDCWGLPQHWYARQYGIALPSLLDDYTSANNKDQVAALVRAQSERWRRVEMPMEGDLVTFKRRGGAWHVGIWLPPSRMLHTAQGIGSCIEFLQTPRWAKRIEAYWRHQARG